MPFQHMNTENSIGRRRMANRILVTNAVLIAYTPWPASIAGMDKDGPNLKAPIVLAVLGAMSAAFVLTIYHCIMITCGNRRRTDQPEGFHTEEGNASSIEISTAQLIPPAYTYEKGKGTVDGEEGEIMCAVCLCEFKEGEAVRLLPKCKHYFHVPCIDRWISSHSSCPMCRTEMSRQHHQQYPEVLPPDLGRVPEFG